MAEESDHISCSEHGEAFATYLCGHLVADPVQQWHCDYPSEDTQWPDAWCSECEAAYALEGEWNEKNEHVLSAKLMCHHCYESAKARSVEHPGESDSESWLSFVADCQEELHRKQELLSTQFSLSKHKRFDWDQETGELIFSNDGVPAVIATIEFVGSISTRSDTWLWSWANFHLLEKVRTRVIAVRELGERKGFPRLTVPKWSAEEVDGWEMAAIATHVLAAHGVYRSPGESGFAFMVITDIRSAH